jgi:hypothetical protein
MAWIGKANNSTTSMSTKSSNLQRLLETPCGGRVVGFHKSLWSQSVKFLVRPRRITVSEAHPSSYPYIPHPNATVSATFLRLSAIQRPGDRIRLSYRRS